MKKLALLTAGLVMAGGVAMAVPYASQIQTSSPLLVVDETIDISYVLNEDADEVIIEILDDQGDPVAEFSGDADQGLNTVTWDGSPDNDGGTQIGVGDGFSIRITVDAEKPEEWYEYASNSSDENAETALTNIPEFWNPSSLLVPNDPESAAFGLLHTTTATGVAATQHAGALAFRSDLELANDDNLFLIPGPGVAALQLSGVSEDPANPGSYFITGQAAAGPKLHYAASPLDGFLPGADPAEVATATDVRNGVVIDVDGTRYVFYASATSAVNSPDNGIWRAELNEENELVGSIVNISAPMDRAIAMVDVATDSAGNLYLASRSGIESGDWAGQVWRWSNATLEAVDTNDPATFLSLDTSDDPNDPSADNADWNLLEKNGIEDEEGIGAAGSVPGFQTRRFSAITVSPDDNVYVLSRRYVYDLGSASQSSLRGRIVADINDVVEERIIDLSGSNDEGLAATERADLAVDIFGNIIVVDSSTSTIRAFSPGGETSTTVSSTSTFSIGFEATAVDNNWLMYQ